MVNIIVKKYEDLLTPKHVIDFFQEPANTCTVCCISCLYYEFT